MRATQHTGQARISYTRAHLPSRFTAWFAVWVCAVIALGVYVHWPSVSSGFRSDDFPQRAMLTGEFPSPRSALDLFNFASGAADDIERLSDFGYLPWWTAPNLRLRMWRPLASALAAGDHALFGDDARMHHVHSLAWYALLCAIAARAYRRWLTWPAALVATLAFALEEGHTVPIGWLANRSTLIATALGLLALELHVRFREGRAGQALSASGERDVRPAQGADSRSAARVLAATGTALCTGLALLAGEYAFTALAYVLAYELLRREPVRARLRGALPVAIPTACYLIAHTLVGSDVVGSGYYISPLRDPLAYAEAALLRIPALFADLTLGLPADWFNGVGPLRNEILGLEWFSPEVWLRLPSWPFWNALIGCAALALAALIWRRGLPRIPPERRRGLSVLALGALLSLLPAAGSLPGDRLIVAAAFGVSGLLATLLVEAFPRPAVRVREGAAWVWRRRPVSPWAALAFAAALIVVGPLGVPRVWNQATDYAFGAEGLRMWSAEAELPERDAADSRVYVLTTADFTTAANLPFVRLAFGRPLPRSYRRLCPAMAPIDVRRTGERSLEILVLASDIQGSAQPSLYRSASAPIETGHRARLPGLDVTVLQARAGNPALMRFDFDLPLEDPRLWFLESSLNGLRRIDPPAIGATLRLPRPHYRDPRFAEPH